MIKRLNNHYSTTANPNYNIIVEGRIVNLIVHSDGIAVDQGNGMVYYQALSNPNLYRVNADTLTDFSLSDTDVSNSVIHVGVFGAADGLVFGNGKLYITAIEDNAIKVYNPVTEQINVVVEQETLKWPDSMSFTNDNQIYVTTSQLHLPRSARGTYKLYQIRL